MTDLRNVPYTTSELVETADRRVVDLTKDGFPEIPVLGMNYTSSASEGSIFHRHRDSLEITLCVRGSAKFDCDRRIHALVPGQVFVSQPQDVHRLRMNQRGARLYWLFFRLPPKGMSALGLSQPETDHLVKALKSLPQRAFAVDDEVRTGFQDLFLAYDEKTERNGAGHLFALRIAILRILASLVKCGCREPSGGLDRLFTSIIDRMRRTPEDNYDIDRLVEETKMSPNTILARFRKLTGLPPHAFLMKCRIRRAMDIMLKENVSVLEVALRLRFASSQHFATRFKQETGMRPKAWRDAQMGVHENAK